MSTETEGAEVVNYTAEWFNQKMLALMNQGDYQNAGIMAQLLEGYLDGLWAVNRFEGGEPVMEITEWGNELLNSKKANDSNWLDEFLGPLEGPLDDC